MEMVKSTHWRVRGDLEFNKRITVQGRNYRFLRKPCDRQAGLLKKPCSQRSQHAPVSLASPSKTAQPATMWQLDRGVQDVFTSCTVSDDHI